MLPAGKPAASSMHYTTSGRNLITRLTSAASPKADISSTCKVGQKLGLSLPLLTCSPSAWPSRLLYSRGRKSRKDLRITLYVTSCSMWRNWWMREHSWPFGSYFRVKPTKTLSGWVQGRARQGTPYLLVPPTDWNLLFRLYSVDDGSRHPAVQ